MLHETFLRVAYIYVCTYIYTYGHTYIKEKERNSTSSAPPRDASTVGSVGGRNMFLYNTLPPEEFNQSEPSGFS